MCQLHEAVAYIGKAKRTKAEVCVETKIYFVLSLFTLAAKTGKHRTSSIDRKAVRSKLKVCEICRSSIKLDAFYAEFPFNSELSVNSGRENGTKNNLFNVLG